MIFRHEANDLVGVVHWADFVYGGRDEDLMFGGEDLGDWV